MVITVNQDFIKYEGYIADLNSNNDKNHLHHTIKSVNLNDRGFLNSYMYTNIYETRQNPYLKLILAINNI